MLLVTLVEDFIITKDTDRIGNIGSFFLTIVMVTIGNVTKLW